MLPTNHVRSPLECAQAQLDAYNARDIERFSEVYADDVELVDLATGDVFCRGIEDLHTRYGAQFARCPDLHCSLVSRIVCPPFVIDEEHVTGLNPAGLVHAVATYQCDNGKIIRAWFIREISE